MSGEIRDLSSADGWPGLQVVEVCVIGSGPGGATAARALAAAGHEVLILEEGVDPNGRKNQRDGAMNDLLYMERGGRMTEDLGVTIMQGRALGGGSVVNISDVVPIDDVILEHWRTVHGLTEVTPAALAAHKNLALGDLHASVVPDALYNLANQKLEAGARKIGASGERMMHNRVGCAGLGTCLLGCPLNAKQNARQVTIPQAVEAGARVFTRARALRIEGAEQEIKTIRCVVMDAKGHREGRPFEVRAQHVILAANAIGSTQLALRSGIGNKHVGRHLSLQPQGVVVGVFDEVIDAFKGVPQAFAITSGETRDVERGLGGYRVEAVFGTPGTAAALMSYSGRAGMDFMAKYRHLAASLCLIPDPPVGEVALRSDGRPLVRYGLTDDVRARLRTSMKTAARAWLAAGARRVEVSVNKPLTLRSEADLKQIDALGFQPAEATLISAHQQGGMRMASSPAGGALDPDAQLYGTRGVYAFDSSGFPSTSSSHTMAPITTMSSFLTARLLARI